MLRHNLNLYLHLYLNLSGHSRDNMLSMLSGIGGVELCGLGASRGRLRRAVRTAVAMATGSQRIARSVAVGDQLIDISNVIGFLGAGLPSGGRDRAALIAHYGRGRRHRLLLLLLTHRRQTGQVNARLLKQTIEQGVQPLTRHGQRFVPSLRIVL
ncbi:hypothetical protein BpHYR1_026561 [Brachionus plicatilis]|uniref:Uncharacterized protein n=1 Tax=Brachionus plicatilis TaxID=10195 RepID=A0A3M7R6H4_BRAPC|nr:hypothetical protein BpHYR1_026561 [Brachionus plicatilis]